MECHLPRRPHEQVSGKAFIIADLMWEVVGHEDSRGGRHHEFNVGDGHARPLCFLLGILQHDDVLGDPICLQLILVHIHPLGNHVEHVKTTIVGIKVLEDCKSRHPCVKCVGVFEVVVPDFINGVAKKQGRTSLGRLVTRSSRWDLWAALDWAWTTREAL